jgi:hypothetical protein
VVSIQLPSTLPGGARLGSVNAKDAVAWIAWISTGLIVAAVAISTVVKEGRKTSGGAGSSGCVIRSKAVTDRHYGAGSSPSRCHYGELSPRPNISRPR